VNYEQRAKTAMRRLARHDEDLAMRDAAIFGMYEVAGMNPSEIGRRLDLSRGTVRSAILRHRASRP